VSRLRRQLIEEKILHDTLVNQERLAIVKLQKSLDDQELMYHNLKGHSSHLEHDNRLLSERIGQNEQIAKEWDEYIVEIN
jgi:hypothetical protein